MSYQPHKMKFLIFWLLTVLVGHSDAGLLTFVRKIFVRRSKTSIQSSDVKGTKFIPSSHHIDGEHLESKNAELFEEVVHLRHLVLKQKKQIQILTSEASSSKRKINEMEASHKVELKALVTKLETDFEGRKQKYLKSLKSEFENKFKEQIKELKASHEMELDDIKKELSQASQSSESSETKRLKEIAKLETKLSKKQEQINELLQLKEVSEQQNGRHVEV